MGTRWRVLGHDSFAPQGLHYFRSNHAVCALDSVDPVVDASGGGRQAYSLDGYVDKRTVEHDQKWLVFVPNRGETVDLLHPGLLQPGPSYARAARRRRRRRLENGHLQSTYTSDLSHPLFSSLSWATRTSSHF